MSSRDMPNAAISVANQANISYEKISLYGNTNDKSLTQWLEENIS